jgi:hypothetical protein
MDGTADRKGTGLLLTGVTYGVLFVFGAVQGMLGSFLYSGMVGPLPLAAIAFCVAILATGLLASRVLGTVSGALVPAIGWIAAAFVLSMPVASGSVIITNTAAGKWFLYGGTLCAVGGVVLASLMRARSR